MCEADDMLHNFIEYYMYFFISENIELIFGPGQYLYLTYLWIIL